MKLDSLFSRSWYGRFSWTWVFLPFRPFVKNAVQKKRAEFLTHPILSYTAPVPVVIVGNISVGGTGKSPMVVALCELLKEHGYHPGIISRGHGVKLSEPKWVDEHSLASEVGDEPAMLWRRTKCPMVVFPNRARAVEYLLEKATSVDVIVCDDGMQHYALDRDIEIAMIDAQRGVGNGQLLPIGPLREPVERLKSVDFVASITSQMTTPLEALGCRVTMTTLTSSHLLSLDGTKKLSFEEAFDSDLSWQVMAGIGNPERFLKSLESFGLTCVKSVHWFSDHHNYIASDIPKAGYVVMTEKDAVKCQNLALENPNIWYLPVSLSLPENFIVAFIDKVRHITYEKDYE